MLYNHVYTKQFGLARRYCSNDEEANWIFNEAMVKIFRSLRDYKSSKDFLGWTYRIILNTTIDYFRKTTNYRSKLFEIESIYEEKFDYNLGLNNLEIEDLFKLIQSLDKYERLVFSLYEIDGFKHKEIAEKLNIGISHSKWLLSKAKKSLRLKIKKNDIKVVQK